MIELGGDVTSYIQSQVKNLKAGYDRKERVNRPFVTISREAGAYGLTIAKKLREYMQQNERRTKCNWTIFDKELLQKVVEEYNLPETVLPYLSESTISEIEDTMEEMLGLHPSRYMLNYKTNKTIFHLAQLGYCILIGRGSSIITSKIPGGVHIRLISPLEKRIDHMKEYLNISAKQAREFVIKKDRARSNYVKKYFEKNNIDPLLYDMVINVDSLGIEETVRVIGAMVLKQ